MRRQQTPVSPREAQGNAMAFLTCNTHLETASLRAANAAPAGSRGRQPMGNVHRKRTEREWSRECGGSKHR